MKLNKTIYNKLLLQAREAQEQGLTKLANGVLDAIGAHPEDESKEYYYVDVKESIYRDLWKSAAKLMVYYDLDSVQIEKLGETISFCADTVVMELERTLNVEDVVKGPLEPSIPGED